LKRYGTYHEFSECLARLLIVSIFRVLAILLFRALGVDGSYKVMENRSCGNTRIASLSPQGLQAVLESLNKRFTRGTRVSGIHNAGRLRHIDAGVPNEVIEGAHELLVRRVREECCVMLPSGFQHLATGIDELHSIILSYSGLG
jgi:hypothetical protein